MNESGVTEDPVDGALLGFARGSTAGGAANRAGGRMAKRPGIEPESSNETRLRIAGAGCWAGAGTEPFLRSDFGRTVAASRASVQRFSAASCCPFFQLI